MTGVTAPHRLCPVCRRITSLAWLVGAPGSLNWPSQSSGFHAITGGETRPGPPSGRPRIPASACVRGSGCGARRGSQDPHPRSAAPTSSPQPRCGPAAETSREICPAPPELMIGRHNRRRVCRYPEAGLRVRTAVASPYPHFRQRRRPPNGPRQALRARICIGPRNL